MALALVLTHSQSKIKSPPIRPPGTFPRKREKGKRTARQRQRQGPKPQQKPRPQQKPEPEQKPQPQPQPKSGPELEPRTEQKPQPIKAAATPIPTTMRCEPSKKSEEQQPPLVKGARRQARGIGRPEVWGPKFCQAKFWGFIAWQAMKATRPEARGPKLCNAKLWGFHRPSGDESGGAGR